MAVAWEMIWKRPEDRWSAASGKLITPAEVASALCAGADSVNSARGFMYALGCIQSLKCNKNTCPHRHYEP